MYQKTSLFGLAYCCPVQNRESDCPFTELDHLSFREKVKWIDNLSDEEKKTILEHHRVCSKNR